MRQTKDYTSRQSTWYAVVNKLIALLHADDQSNLNN